MLATRERWTKLCLKNDARDDSITSRTIDSTYDEIFAIYSDPDRHYHNLYHISDSLAILDEYRKKSGMADYETIEFGIWGHDLVNNPGYAYDEEDSQNLFTKILGDLGLRTHFRIRVSNRIFSTKHDHIPMTFEDQIMASIDLVPLALPSEQFNLNTTRVREEWRTTVPDDRKFAVGRAEFFRDKFLSRSNIYHTPYFRNKYEFQARENLQKFIDLTGI